MSPVFIYELYILFVALENLLSRPVDPQVCILNGSTVTLVFVLKLVQLNIVKSYLSLCSKTLNTADLIL